MQISALSHGAVVLKLAIELFGAVWEEGVIAVMSLPSPGLSGTDQSSCSSATSARTPSGAKNGLAKETHSRFEKGGTPSDRASQ